MKILFAGNTLADSAARLHALGLRVDGQGAVDAADILRSAAKRVFHRGNKAHSITFSVVREFETFTDAEIATFTVHSYMAGAGIMEIQCGETGETLISVFAANCVLAAISAVQTGVSVLFSYSFTCGLLTTGAPPDWVKGGEEVMATNIVTLGAGVESVPVLFDPPFPGAGPVAIQTTLTRPNGSQPRIHGEPDQDTISPTGFTFSLDALTPIAGYRLHWQAIQKP